MLIKNQDMNVTPNNIEEREFEINFRIAFNMEKGTNNLDQKIKENL